MVGYDPEGKELPQFAYGVAGAVSGFMTRAVSQPLDVLKIRLQVNVINFYFLYDRVLVVSQCVYVTRGDW